ncbi:transposase, partial [Shigella boydii]
SLKTSIKTITYLSDIGCLEIQGASLVTDDVIKFAVFRVAVFYTNS